MPIAVSRTTGKPEPVRTGFTHWWHEPDETLAPRLYWASLLTLVPKQLKMPRPQDLARASTIVVAALELARVFRDQSGTGQG